MPGKDQRDLKQQGSKSKGDAKSRDGRKQKKGGKGGKKTADGSRFSENLDGGEDFPSALDKNDPNYDKDGADDAESHGKPQLSIFAAAGGDHVNDPWQQAVDDEGLPVPAKEQLRARFVEFGQEHVFEYIDKGEEYANKAQQNMLLRQLDTFDLGRIETLHRDAMAFDAKPKDTNFAPPDNFDATETASAADREKWQKTGFAAIARGEVAAMVLAGGAGTRLGFDHPKGMFNLDLPSNKTIFQLFVERLMKLSHLAASDAGKATKHIPFFIMTSEGTNHNETEAFFKENDFFGYGEENVKFFSQGVLPCMTTAGKLMLETGFKVGVAADGNGGVYGALQNTGQIDAMQKRGVKYVHVFSVDNAIGKAGDPMFMGYCIERGSDVGNKVVWKVAPDEAVGVLGQISGKNSIIEYSELFDKNSGKAIAFGADGNALMDLRNEQGKLLFGAGNICNHFFTLDFLASVKDEDLIFHVAKKKIPMPSPRKGQNAIKPDKETGIKLECFIFDCFGKANNMAILEGPRDEEFSPVKNKHEDTPKDSPQTARAMLTAQNVKWLRAAGFTVTGGEKDGDGKEQWPFQCELSPFVTYRGEGLETLKAQRGEGNLTIDLSKEDFYADAPPPQDATASFDAGCKGGIFAGCK